MEGSAIGFHFGRIDEFSSYDRPKYSDKQLKVVKDIIKIIEQEIQNTKDNYSLSKVLLQIERKYNL